MNKQPPHQPRRRGAATLPSRYEFLRPLCEGRRVADVAATPAARTWLTEAGAVVVPACQDADIVLALDPCPAADLAKHLEAMMPAEGGILAVAVTGDRDAARAALSHHFPHIAAFAERGIAGTIILDERFRESRVVPLRAPAGGEASLFLGSAQPLPVPPGGLFEQAVPPAGSVAIAPDTPPSPALLSTLSDLLAPDPHAADMRANAVALTERLMDVEETVIALRLANHHLRTTQPAAGGDSRYNRLGGPRHEWPLAERADALADDLPPYDRRPDDAVVREGRAGAAFMERFGLEGDAPDFVAAVAALNAMDAVLDIDTPVPAASIVVPVYGQLGYTLNCLDSLFRHRSKYGAEIIVVDDVSPDRSGEFLPRVDGIRHHRQAVNGGFIQSCATGAALARGGIVIFLNNDTRVVDGWLDELLDTFVTFPAAGAAGSKLFYADGTLQEAGGIIWRDGTAWNYGRNDDPNRPDYSFARRVDYCSGCSLAVPITVWRELGGFDAAYRPAYCEDSDFCLKVVASGREVWMQPRSRVVHYEGKTSGTDLASGVKAYQVVNQKKLYMRWRAHLLAHRPNGEAPLLERERATRLRALIVDATAPTPKQDAGSVTTTLTLGLFRDLGYKPHFVPQDNFLFQDPYIPDLQRLGVECAYAPYDTDFDDYMRRNGWQFDVVLVYRVTVLEKVLDAIRRHAPHAPLLFHNMDLHFLRMQREAALSGDPDALAAATAMKDKECGLIRRVDCTITHSTYEKDVIGAEVPGAPVVVWPFMFEFFGTNVGFAARRDFVFLGGYRHTPNVDAVVFFVRDVLPLIRAEEPDARFIIAGANPSDDVLALANEAVIVTGLVDDLRDVFDTARVFACSLRIGAGTKGKVSTAMSYGLPVVSTSCGAEGMDLIDGRDVLIADEAADFAAACLRLYRDEALWNHVSQAGQDLVREKHSLAMGRRVLAEAIEVAHGHRLGLDATPA